MTMNPESPQGTSLGWLARLLGDPRDHYSCFLPERIGRVTQWLLRLLFSGIRLERDQAEVIRSLPAEALIVYVTPYRSVFEFLFYYIRYQREGLPFPQVGFDYRLRLWQPLRRQVGILLAFLNGLRRDRRLPDPYASGFIRQELLQGRAALASLMEPRDFYRRFVKAKTDPLRHLIEFQQSLDRPLVLVPQLFFYGRKPDATYPSLTDMLFGSEQRPGLWRKLATLLKSPGRVFIEVSEPLDLQAFLARPENRDLSREHLAQRLRRLLIGQLERHRQTITGPTLKTPDELEQAILTGPGLRDFMAKYAKRREIPLYEAHREAHRYLDEIAANPSPGFVRLGLAAVRWFLERMFEGVVVNTEGLNRMKRASMKGPLVLVPCHRSHMDYLLLSQLMYDHNLSVPLVFAGQNLAFWPMGPFFRRTGAFFVRRSLAGAVFYTKVLSEYLFKLLEEGFHIEFFIEGTRSRTGKLLPPRLGALSMLLGAYRAGACPDLVFVPIYIGYDRVPEESAYVHEVKGGQKDPESLGGLFRAWRLLGQRHGRIYIHFDEPLPVSRLEAEAGRPLREMSSKDQNLLCRDLGARIMSAIDQATVVTPQALMAGALLAGSKELIPHGILLFRVETILRFLKTRGTRFSEILTLDPHQAVGYILKHFQRRRLVERIADKQLGAAAEPHYRINPGRHATLEYYKNNIISQVVPAAMVALLIFEKEAFQFSAADLNRGYRDLTEMFAGEFTTRIDQPPEATLRKTVKAMIDDAVLMPHPTLPDTYNITSAGYRKLKVFSNFMQPFIEAYWVVLSYFRRFPREAHGEKERLRKIIALGKRLLKIGEIERPGGLSKIYYASAVEFFMRNGVRGSEDMEAIERYSTILRHHLDHLPV
jgi:glycerol-3-phosphate O-acyltransferase